MRGCSGVSPSPAAPQVWSTTQPAAVAAIDLRANVCCAKYNPACAREVAVGCADHNVHLFDLRNASRPVHVFTGARGRRRTACVGVPVYMQYFHFCQQHIQ